MKKILSLTALILCLVLVLASCGGKKKDPSVPDGMKLASGEQADYFMYVPENWKVDKTTLYTSAFFSSGDATSISVTAYGMNFSDSTVDDWWNGYTEQFKSTFSDMEVTSSDKAKLGGVDGMKYTYEASLAGVQYKYICLAAVKDNYVYYMLYTSTSDYYDDHLKDLDSVIQNFKFKS